MNIFITLNKFFENKDRNKSFQKQNYRISFQLNEIPYFSNVKVM